eukprot:2267209-Pleurochrysis_carterae.AAC.1
MFKVAALDLKKFAESSLFCLLALGMYVACWRRFASAIAQVHLYALGNGVRGSEKAIPSHEPSSLVELVSELPPWERGQ